MEALHHLLQKVEPGARIERSWPLLGGVSARVQALEFTRPDGSSGRLVVRQRKSHEWKPVAPEEAAREHALLVALHARGLPVPRSRHFEPPDTLVQELIAGTSALPSDFAAPLAETLALIHAVPVAELPALPPREDPVPELRSWFSEDAVWVERLPHESRARGAVCLLHGDFWPGNILWNEGRLQAVIDWEDAACGDPLSDLACARVELGVVAGPDAMELFTRLYLARVDVDPALLPLWDLYVSTAALRSMDQWGLAPEDLERRRAFTRAFQQRAYREVPALRRAPATP